MNGMFKEIVSESLDRDDFFTKMNKRFSDIQSKIEKEKCLEFKENLGDSVILKLIKSHLNEVGITKTDLINVFGNSWYQVYHGLNHRGQITNTLIEQLLTLTNSELSISIKN